jgi:hypothetical protein
MFHQFSWGRRGCDRMVVRFTTTYAISAYHHWCCEFDQYTAACSQYLKIWKTKGHQLNWLVGWFMVLKATFNNISFISRRYNIFDLCFVWKCNDWLEATPSPPHTHTLKVLCLITVFKACCSYPISLLTSETSEQLILWMSMYLARDFS